MLPNWLKTEVWRELAESLSAKLKVPVFCGAAVFGKLSFFQELRNRLSDSPFSSVSGIRYVEIKFDDSSIFVGPFKTAEPHAFDEELSDAREKLPVWSDDFSELIDLAVRQAAYAGRSERLLRDSLSRAKLLLEFSQAVSHVQDVDRALYVSVQFLAHKFKLSNVFLSVLGRQARHFDVSDSAKLVEQRVVAQVRSTKTPCSIQNVVSDFLLEGIENRESLPKCVVGFPLTSNRELIGAAILYSEALPVLDSVGEVLYELVSVLERLSRFEKVQESAVTDALTGLSNRAELVKRFDALLADCSSRAAPLSVLMIDVDNFKNLNDTKGHQEGDRILRVVSDVLKSAVSKQGICARYGGEEFAVVLAGSPQDAKDMAEKIRSEVEKSCELTVSVGVLTCMNSSVSRDFMVREADRAMYRAKHLGKNKVVAFLMLDKSLGVIDA